MGVAQWWELKGMDQTKNITRTTTTQVVPTSLAFGRRQ